ncbi:MAG: FG-GAP repeat domain-containing protein [Candidatus Binatia bacterium]
MTTRRPWLGTARLTALLALLLAGAAPAQQEVRFRTHSAFPIGGVPADLVLGHFNDDEELDVVVANYGDGTISVLLGSGTGDFTVLDPQPASGAPTQMAAADFDKDTKLDLVVSETESDFIYFLRGHGDGTFDQPVRVSSGHDPVGVAAADMDADGNLDVVVSIAGEAIGRVSVLLGDGTGKFSLDEENRSRRVNTQSTSVAVGDFSGDDKLDVAAVTLATDRIEATLSILLGDGLGGIDRPIMTAAPERPIRIATVDFNGDGPLDLITADGDQSTVTLLHGVGDGSFTKVGSFGVGNGPATVFVADVDLDGQADAVTANQASGDVSVLYGTAEGFGLTRSFLAPVRTSSAASADFNRDGRMDLIAASSADFAGDAILLLGRPGGFEGVESLLSSVGLTGAAIGDIDGDGLPDIVFVSGSGGTIQFLPSRTTGGFDAAVDIADPLGVGPLRLADLNRDGRLDVLAASIEQPDVYVVMARADGSGFMPPASVEIAGPTMTIAVGDFDADGHPDFAAPVAGAAGVSVRFGNGDGTFVAVPTIPVGGSPSGISVGHFNGDRLPDLAVGNTRQGSIALLFSNGDRSFAASTAETGTSPFFVSGGDVDADGHDDLIAAVGTGQMRLFYANGDGTFGPAVNLGASGLAASLRDVTGDARPDVLIAKQVDNSVAIIPNAGNRAFGPSVTYPVGLRPVGIAAADFDADGRYDLLARGNTAWVLTNTADAANPRGDGNGDGTRSAADVTALATALARAPVQSVEDAAQAGGVSTGIDTDGDGSVDGRDLPLLIRRLFRPV